MAAGGSNLKPARRGARTRQGAMTRREGLVPSPFRLESLDTLQEISGWLGTFSERLRLAHDERARAAELS